MRIDQPALVLQPWPEVKQQLHEAMLELTDRKEAHLAATEGLASL